MGFVSVIIVSVLFALGLPLVLLSPPTFRRMWIGDAHGLALGLGVGHFTVLISVALALLLVTRVRDRLDAHSLALTLATSALWFECYVVGDTPDRGAGNLGFALWFALPPIVAAAALRFATLFPRPLSVEDIEWAAETNVGVTTTGPTGSIEAADAWLSRWARQLLPAASHRHLGLEPDNSFVSGVKKSHLVRLIKAAQSGNLYVPALLSMSVSLLGWLSLSAMMSPDPGRSGPKLWAFIVLFVCLATPAFMALALVLLAFLVLRIGYARCTGAERRKALWSSRGWRWDFG